MPHSARSRHTACSQDNSATSVQQRNRYRDSVTHVFNAVTVFDYEQYPKTHSELRHRLESSNSLHPANIPMVVVKAYCPSHAWKCKDEVSVSKGMLVNAMYKASDWVCVRTPEERTGFVPAYCLEPIGVKRRSKDFGQQFPERTDSYRSTVSSICSNAATYRSSMRSFQRSSFRKATETGYKRSRSTEDQRTLHKNLPPILPQPLPQHKVEVDRRTQIVPNPKVQRPHSQCDDLRRTCLNKSVPLPIKSAKEVDQQKAKRSHHRNATYNGQNKAQSEVHPFTRAVREAAKIVLKDYYVQALDSNNNNVTVRHLKGQTAPVVNKPLAEQNQNIPRQSIPQKQAKSSSDSEEPHNKVNDMYFAHDMSSIGFMLPYAKTPVKSPVRRLSFSSDISDISSVFTKTEGPQLTVLFDYTAQDENDVTVLNNEIVTLLNDEDEDWIWVKTNTGKEGFIPRIYAINLEVLDLDPREKTTYL